MLTNKDLEQVQVKGVQPSEIYQQVDFFTKGFPWMLLNRSAKIDDGIILFSDDEVSQYEQLFEQKKSFLSILKFVPASGAATRMFKSLFEHVSDGVANNESRIFLERLTEFAFYTDLMAVVGKNATDIQILKGLLAEEGLEYGMLPKGLLAFHPYDFGFRTPMEEHLMEAATYATDGKVARLHFTVSPEHRPRFQKLVDQVTPNLEAQFGLKFEINFSEQKPATDTVAVELDNSLFREQDGTLLFRPAGHGALLENLNDLSADLIFIKNIDNVVPDRLKSQTILYKKALGGYLLHILDQIKFSLMELEGNCDELCLERIEKFVSKNVGFMFGLNFLEAEKEQKKGMLRSILNRPTRICGVVKNMGEPGGGPFWCLDEEGNASLQLVESAQVDLSNQHQMEIFTGSTHFNPVDLVCATRDAMGNSFNLLNFRDVSTGFITEKTKDGRKLKAQELPGLWNGAMANWNTIFVEVPLATFNPVKTITDLLRPAHQN